MHRAKRLDRVGTVSSTAIVTAWAMQIHPGDAIHVSTTLGAVPESMANLVRLHPLAQSVKLFVCVHFGFLFDLLVGFHA